MARVIVLGAGMVGRAMALDLARRHDVVCCDRSEQALAQMNTEAAAQGIPRPPQTLELDAGDSAAVPAAVSGFDLAVTAVPGFLGYATLRAVIEAGVNVADISFFPEDALALDSLAKAKGVCAVVDVGVAPGLDNLIFGAHDREWNVSYFECLVGGLPTHPRWPWRYKAPFSPVDVVEEYLRPARLMEGGRVVVKPALSEPEFVEIPDVGSLEAFNTDGLRSLLTTMSHVPDMREKTLRWPGHRELALALRESGFLSEEPIEARDAEGNLVRIIPREATSRMLFREWELERGEAEFTAMRVTVRGSDKRSGEPREAVWHLLDRGDAATATSSMARTTGYTCTAAADLLLSDFFTTPGVHPPERLGAVPGALDRVLAHLEQRAVCIQRS
ncbi:MAG: saccharopine dehydrogenase NADP-binding domain-containing protein [Planctomycetota bacterium]|nr:saccharopine dehydrogenase NADP-binding domain-containing protein [Planctomycetota bacterium]